MAVRGGDFVCLADEGGLNHIDTLLEPKYTAKDVGTLGLEESDTHLFLWLNRFVLSGDRSNRIGD